MPIYPKRFQPIQYINKIPYLIHAVFPISYVKDVTMLKEYLGVDIAFKQNSKGVFLFAEEIKETEFEEIK